MKHDSPEIIASNRKARHNYTIVDVIEAGIVLHGSEVKSLREGQVQIAEAYAHVVRGEMWLEGVHVAVYRFSHGVGSHEPMRSRKLLLNKREINKLIGAKERDGYTMVATAMYWKGPWVKLEFYLAKGKREFDKRDDIKDRDWSREKERMMKHSKR